MFAHVTLSAQPRIVHWFHKSQVYQLTSNALDFRSDRRSVYLTSESADTAYTQAHNVSKSTEYIVIPCNQGPSAHNMEGSIV